MAVFSPVGSSSISGSVSITGATTPTIANVSVPLASTEVSYALPANTKKFYIQLRDPKADLQLAYSAGTSGTIFVTVHRGTWYGEEILTASAVTLYFQSASGSQTAEIVSWV